MSHHEEVADLMAEVEALTAREHKSWKEIERLRAERDRLMRNHDPAPITYAEWEDAQEELDRLRAEVHEANAACDAQVRECNRLRAENERLRELMRLTLAEWDRGSVRFDHMAAIRDILSRTDPPKETE